MAIITSMWARITRENTRTRRTMMRGSYHCLRKIRWSTWRVSVWEVTMKRRAKKLMKVGRATKGALEPREGTSEGGHFGDPYLTCALISRLAGGALLLLPR